MIDMTQTIIAKSDQCNADDLIGRNLTIKITKVSLVIGEQPVIINYENDNGKPYKPGKSMRRVLVSIWGADGNKYIGKSLTLYRDDKVTFGGLNVGGLRISHMSHIDNPVTLVLTASKANKKPFTVKPLIMEVDSSETLKLAGREEAKKGAAALKLWWGSLGGEKQKMLGVPYLDEVKAIAAKQDDWGVPADKETANHSEDKLDMVAKSIPLIDRVSSMIARIHMDRENQGTDDFENVTESDEFKALWAEVKVASDKEQIGRISAAMEV